MEIKFPKIKNAYNVYLFINYSKISTIILK